MSNTTRTRKAGSLCANFFLRIHDAAIADADEAKHLIPEAYVIIEDFFECVMAAPRPLLKRPIKTKGQVGGGDGVGAEAEVWPLNILNLSNFSHQHKSQQRDLVSLRFALKIS